MSIRDVNWGILLTEKCEKTSVLNEKLLTPELQGKALESLRSRNPLRAEDWRYTNLKTFSDVEFSGIDYQETSWEVIEKDNSGSRVDSNSLRICTLSELAQQNRDSLAQDAWSWISEQMKAEDALTQLQTLHLQDGLVLLVAEGEDGGDVYLTRSKNEFHFSTSMLNLDTPNLWVYLAPRAKLSIHESYGEMGVEQQTSELAEGEESHKLTLGLTGLYLSESSNLSYLRSQTETRQLEQESNYHLARVSSILRKQAELKVISLNLGSDLCRLELDVSLEESEAKADLNGLYLGSGTTQLDQHLILRHKAPNCSSAQRFKGAFGGRSKGIFTGRVIVAKGASQTRADQNNPNLLLSTKAKAITRPQLEIYNDEVECSHGATAGQLDEDALFYLKARGMNEASALRALTSAFVGELREQVIEPRLTKAIDMALWQALELHPNEVVLGEEWLDWTELDQALEDSNQTLES